MTLQFRLLMLAAVLQGVACSGEAFVRLPPVQSAQGWLLFNASERGEIFNSDVAASLKLGEGASLTALPVTSYELGVAPGEVATSEGRLVPVLGSFVYADSAWQASQPVRIQLPLEFAACADRCLALAECPSCSISQSAQVCGSCPGDLSVLEPDLPDAACPAGWQSHEAELGHHYCSAPVPDGISQVCPPQQRWSMTRGACIDYADCAAPTVEPGATVIYVDPTAGPGGDGSAAAPLQQYLDLVDSVTVVLAPGSHPGVLTIDRSDVRLLGHGVCTQIGGPVRVNGAGISIDGVSIEPVGRTNAVRVAASADAVISNSRIVAEAGAIAADGYLVLFDSLVQSRAERAHAVVFAVGGSVSSSDIVATNTLRTAGGVLEVRDTRLLAAPERGFGVSSDSLAAATFERVAVVGFNTGVALRGLDGRVVVTDLLLRSKEDPTGGGHGFLVTGVSGSTASVHLSRIDIDAEEAGVSIELAKVVAQDVRVRSDERAFVHTSNNEPRQLDLHRAWLDYSDAGFRAIDIGSTLTDIWLRRSSDLSTQRTVTAILGEQCDLVGHRIHVVATGGDGIDGFNQLDIDDLTLKDFRLLGVGRNRDDGSPRTSGERWRLQGSGIGIDLAGGFDLLNLVIDTPAGGDAMTPICAQPSAQGFISGFDLRRSPSRPSVAILEPLNLDVSPADLRFSRGQLRIGRLVEKTSDCLSGAGTPDKLPMFDGVAQRAEM